MQHERADSFARAREPGQSLPAEAVPQGITAGKLSNLPEDQQTFRGQVIFILAQMQRLQRSFVGELDDMQLEALSKLFTERSVFPGQFWCREGEPAHTLAIILVGHLAVQNDDSILRPGDIVGDRELCGQHIWSSSVRGVEPSLLAEIDFQVLSQFIEGMGLKKARRLSKIIADNVLERVKEEKARLEEQDRQKLSTIGFRRRGAICSAVTWGAPILSVKRDEDSLSTLRKGSIFKRDEDSLSTLKRGSMNSTYSASDAGNENEHNQGLIERSTVAIAKNPSREAIKCFNESLHEAFQSIRLFLKMEEKLNKKVRACFHTLQVKEGDIVITSGENCEAFYVVHQGEVGMYAESNLTNRRASKGEEDGAEGFNSLALDASAYELHTMEEEGAESASSATPRASPRAAPLVSQSTATPMGFKTPLTSPLASVADGRAERQEDGDVIEYSRKGFPAVFFSETSGWIQVRRRKRSQKSDPNATRMTLVKKLKRGEAFGETALVCGSPGNVTFCALCDSTLLLIGRERLLDVQLQFAQKRFYSLKTIVENTPYARHLPQDIVCKLTDAVEIKEFADGDIIVNENMVLGLDECFTVMSGCVSHFKTQGFDVDSSKKKEFQRSESGEGVLKTFLRQAKPSQIQTEGETFNVSALEDLRVEDDITKVRIIPTYMCSGPTTCVSISRSVYKELVGRYVVSDREGITIEPDDDVNEPSRFAALKSEKDAPKKKPVEASRLPVPKGENVSKALSDGTKGAPRKMGLKNDAAPARLRGHLGKTGPQAKSVKMPERDKPVEGPQKVVARDAGRNNRRKSPSPREVEFVSFEDEEYESFEESEDEERDECLKRADDGKETLQGEKELRLVIRDVLLHLIDVVAKEIGQGTTGSQGDMEEGDGWGIPKFPKEIVPQRLKGHVEEAGYPRSGSDDRTFQSRRSPGGNPKTPGTAKSKGTNEDRSRPGTRTLTPLVKSATPGGSKFHLGSVLLPEKEDFRFQSAGGSGRVSERHLNSSKRSSSAMSDRDPEMLVSFDEGSADVNEIPVQGKWRPDNMTSKANNLTLSDDEVAGTSESSDHGLATTDEDDDVRVKHVHLPHLVPQHPRGKLMSGPKYNSTPGPADYTLPRKKIRGGRISVSILPDETDMLQRQAAQMPGPGQYDLSQSLPDGGRFNKHRPKSIFEMEIISKRNIPGPGAYENLREAFPEDPCGIRIDLSDRKSISKMREIIRRAQDVPGPGMYELDVDSILARQRRIVDRAFAIEARKKSRKSSKGLPLGAVVAEKKPDFNRVKDVIRRFASDLSSEPSTQLPDPRMLHGEILECAAAKRAYAEMLAQRDSTRN